MTQKQRSHNPHGLPKPTYFPPMPTINKIQQPPAPPPPPSRQFRHGLFGNDETGKSIRDRRDWEMFMKGYRFALGEPNFPQPGDYL